MNSIDFVRSHITGGYTGFECTESDFDEAVVLPLTKVFDRDKMEKHYISQDGRPGFDGMGVTIKHTPENDFEYIHSVSSYHDGTMIFYQNDLLRLIYDIYTGNTYNREKVQGTDFETNFSHYDCKLECGDVVILSHSKTITDNQGSSFPEERSFICVPIKWSFQRKGSTA